MSRTALIFRELRCTECGTAARYQFWTRATLLSSQFDGKRFEPTYAQLRCQSCGADARHLADTAPERCNVFSQLRSELRPVVYRWFDARGHEHYRYPARNDAPQRDNEERVEFTTLSEMRSFLKEQNPGWHQWQVPTNDILEYDNADSAIDETDIGVADEADDILSVDEAGVLDSAPADDVKFSIAEKALGG